MFISYHAVDNDVKVTRTQQKQIMFDDTNISFGVQSNLCLLH